VYANAWQDMMDPAETRGPAGMASAYATQHGPEEVDEDELRIDLAARVIERASKISPWMREVLFAHHDAIEHLSGPEARNLALGGWGSLLTSDWPFTRALGGALERASWEV
jgi:hypothetical protein